MGPAFIRKLHNESKPVDYLTARARLLSDKFINDDLHLQILTSDEFLNEWNVFDAKYESNLPDPPN